MQAIEKLLLIIGADVKDAEQKISGLTQKLDRMSTNMSNVGKCLTTFVTLPLIGVGAAASRMAMDAVESENLFEVSMGNMAGAAREWSEEMSKSLGMNSYELRNNVGMLYNMFSSMKLGEKGAYDMATGLTQLAYDMASFYNLSADEAFEKLRAGITGESEPLKRLGILIDENTIKTYAYTHGITKQGDKLTEQEKVFARYGAILEQTKNAQGDLARTMDSPSNKLRILKSRATELGIKFGELLLPVLEKGIDILKRITDWLYGMDESTRKVIVGLAAFAAVTGPVLIGLSKVIGALRIIIPLFTGSVGVGTAAKIAGAEVAGAGVVANAGWLPLLGTLGKVSLLIGGLVAAGILAKKGGDAKAKRLLEDYPANGGRMPSYWDKRGQDKVIEHINNVSGYATGGIVTRKTLAWIGEAGPEAIIPLTGKNAFSSRQNIVHSGTITVRGINNTGDLIGITEIIAKKLAADNRRISNRTRLIPI